NIDYTESELSYFIGDAEPTLIVCRPESEPLFQRLTQGRITIRSLGLQGEGTLKPGNDKAAPVPREADDLAAILYTSGTTGKPKGAMLSHGNLLSNAMTLVDLWRFTAKDTLIHALPIFHVHGLFVACHCALLSGSKMIFLPRFDVKRVIGLMAR